MNENQKKLVQESFVYIEQAADAASFLFYKRLFELAPSLRPLFSGDFTEQRHKFHHALKTIVDGSNDTIGARGFSDLNRLIPKLQMFAERHVVFGLHHSFYPIVGSVFLWTLEELFGDQLTEDLRAAWTAVCELVSNVMFDAAEFVSIPFMAQPSFTSNNF